MAAKFAGSKTKFTELSASWRWPFPTDDGAKQACLQEAQSLAQRWHRAAYLRDGEINHTKILVALRTWSKQMGWNIKSIINAPGRTPSWGVRPLPKMLRKPEGKYEATLHNIILKATHDVLGLDLFENSNSALIGRALIQRLRDATAYSDSAMFIDVASAAASVVGCAAVPDKRRFDIHMPILEAFEAGCFFVWVDHDIIRYITKPYVIRVSSQGLLHCENGPALVWGQGVQYFYWKGTHVHRDVVMTPVDAITHQMIDTTPNVEMRRILLERVGEDRYIEMSEMEPVDHHDKFGTLYFKRFFDGGRPVCRLKVINRSPEPDGTYRIYWLPINPDCYNGVAGRNAHAAAASTWRTTPGGSELFFESYLNYNPQIET